MELSGKIAIVTGASSGIGAEFSRDLVKKGAIVYGLARRVDRLKELEVELNTGKNGKFIAVEMDVTQEKKLNSWVEETFGQESASLPDILINNAGYGQFAPVEKMSTGEFDRMMSTNMNAVFYLTRLIVPLMKKNPDVCHIVNVSSVAGLMGNPNISVYNATKFALRGFSEALFKELREDGIKVSCIFPGSISTEFFDQLGMETHDHMMRPQDISASVLFLLETPDNFLINEMTLRPLNPKAPVK
jgi:NADP-dependent 3-hydroxy acid dehydrogenase YdfG